MRGPSVTQQHTQNLPKRAMILAAGEGRRMRPLTERRPKPLIEVQGRAMIDRILDHLAEVGVEEVVVNLHYLGDQLRSHLSTRKQPILHFSPEETLLETGGGVTKALPLLGEEPFFVLNSDIVWLDGTIPALARLAARWQPASMDALLLMHPTVSAHGYDGLGDYWMDPMGVLTYRPERAIAPFVFAGIQILSPSLFKGCKVERFPLLERYRVAEESGRLHGLRHQGEWFQVGTPEDLTEAEAILTEMGFQAPP